MALGIFQRPSIKVLAGVDATNGRARPKVGVARSIGLQDLVYALTARRGSSSARAVATRATAPFAFAVRAKRGVLVGV